MDRDISGHGRSHWMSFILRCREAQLGQIIHISGARCSYNWSALTDLVMLPEQEELSSGMAQALLMMRSASERSCAETPIKDWVSKLRVSDGECPANDRPYSRHGC